MKVKTGTPTENGMYVIYTDSVLDAYPDKELMMFIDGKWGYRSSDANYRVVVYGWIGPLPCPRKDDLNPDEDENLVYTIGHIIGRYSCGFSASFKETLDCIGNEGDYIYRINGYGEAIAIRKWSEKRLKWIKIKKEQ